MVRRIVSGFPGVGKSFFQKQAVPGTSVWDLDISGYLHAEDFPFNYGKAIESHLQQQHSVMVSSSRHLRHVLEVYQWSYYLVYPSVDCFEEYIDRFIDRGSDIRFLRYMGENWDSLLRDCKIPTAGAHQIELRPGQYLSDVLLATPRGIVCQ